MAKPLNFRIADYLGLSFHFPGSYGKYHHAMCLLSRAKAPPWRVFLLSPFGKLTPIGLWLMVVNFLFHDLGA